MIGKLLKWLFRRLFSIRHDYYDLGNGKVLKVRRGAAEIIDIEDVPARYRPDDPRDSQALTRVENALAGGVGRQSRVSFLKSLHPFAVLEKALQNSTIERDVLENPALVDADSPFEAQLKLDLIDGADIEQTIAADEDHSVADVEEMLDTEFLARWGYNKFGDDLADRINTGDTSAPTGTAPDHHRATDGAQNPSTGSAGPRRPSAASEPSTGGATGRDEKPGGDVGGGTI